MARKKKTSKKKTSKKVRTRRQNWPTLKSASAQQELETLEAATLQLLKVVEKTTLVPIGYMRHVFTELTSDFRRNLKTRRVDPIVRKKARLFAKIEKLQQELATIEK